MKEDTLIEDVKEDTLIEDIWSGHKSFPHGGNKQKQLVKALQCLKGHLRCKISMVSARTGSDIRQCCSMSNQISLTVALY